MKQMLEKIMENGWLYPVFQPIVSLRDGSIIGYEALSRLSDEAKRESISISIEELFNMALECKMVWQLDYLCRRNAIKAYFGRMASGEKKLFINVCPSIMEDKRFVEGFTNDYLGRFFAKTEDIVFEITEKEAICDKDAFERLVLHYKTQGFDIAIDDVGSAHSGLERICFSHPNYIKLDMPLIKNIHNNSIKASLVKGLLDFANDNNIKIIAEGIETKEDMEKLINIGVHYGQGYYLSRPQKELSEVSDEIKKQIYLINQEKHKSQNLSVNQYYIKNITKQTLTVSPEKNIVDILEHFKLHPELPGVCVCKNRKIQGVITRERLMKLLGGKYGFSLYETKPIAMIMNKEFLCVDYEMPISSVSEMAMKRNGTEVYDFIVVSNHDEYYGVITIKDLLMKATQINIQTAKAANPLTGLPGNVVIEQKIEQCINDGKEYTILYLDLDNFKAYNDTYGFEKGDKIIELVADVLNDIGNEGNFVGHIGGDDFVVILHTRNWMKYSKQIEEEFSQRVRDFYNAEDRERGYIIAANRHGEIEQYPLASITIVGISDNEHNYRTQYEVTEELAKRKKEKKKQKMLLVC